jgi:hypothetical protein
VLHSFFQFNELRLKLTKQPDTHWVKKWSKVMMTQTRLPFQYHIAKNKVKATGLAGLFLYLELAYTSGLCGYIQQHFTRKEQGWSELQMIVCLVLLNIAGGDSVEDIERLEADLGLCAVLRRCDTYGLKPRARAAYEKRWRKGQQRALPSPSALHRYLKSFHRADQEVLRSEGQAFIPAPSPALEQLSAANDLLIHCLQQQHPCERATLDQDATLCPTQKRTALYCYKHYQAYQPITVYWHEQRVVLYSELRDGNVPANYNNLRVLRTALDRLPQSVKTVNWRSDTAGYQRELLRYCAEGKHPRFGIIKFAVTVLISKDFKEAALEVPEADWQPVFHIEPDGQHIRTGQSWAEVCYLPIWIAYIQKDPYRFIAIREPLVGNPQEATLPFATLNWSGQRYKIFGIVTNCGLSGNDLIHWYRKRCGDSEQVHSRQKSDLAGGRFPSGKFGANAAWWQIVLLAFNLNALMQRHVLPKAFRKSRLKTLRFHLIALPGCVIQHARKWVVKVWANTPLSEALHELRARILELALPPPITT